MGLFAQLFVNGLINGSHYALLGVGFGLIFATTRIVHFAYGPIFTAAAYAAWFAANVLGLPIAAAMLFAAAVAAALGVITYQYLYLPFERGQS
jgi:branched-chain amino acid transport system permease protein